MSEKDNTPSILKKSNPPVDEDGFPLNIKDIPYNSSNPFTKEVIEVALENTVKGRVKRRERVINIGVKPEVEELEINPGIYFKETEFVDRASYTKVYHNYLKLSMGIGESAAKLYELIPRMIPKDADEIYIDAGTACHYLDCSKRTYHRAMRELLKARLLMKGTRINRYFIHPLLMFNGDRVTYIKNWIIADQEKQTDELREGLNVNTDTGEILPNENFDSYDEIE